MHFVKFMISQSFGFGDCIGYCICSSDVRDFLFVGSGNVIVSGALGVGLGFGLVCMKVYHSPHVEASNHIVDFQDFMLLLCIF